MVNGKYGKHCNNQIVGEHSMIIEIEDSEYEVILSTLYNAVKEIRVKEDKTAKEDEKVVLRNKGDELFKLVRKLDRRD
jgi:hypothetical protein